MGRRLVLDPLHELDPVVDHVGVEVLDLLLREVDLFEPGDDVVVGEEAFVLPIGDELVELLDVGQRDVDREQLTSPFLVTAATFAPWNEKSRRASPPGSRSCGLEVYNRLWKSGSRISVRS